MSTAPPTNISPQPDTMKELWEVGWSTVTAINSGYYTTLSGDKVSISSYIDHLENTTRVISPDENLSQNLNRSSDDEPVVLNVIPSDQLSSANPPTTTSNPNAITIKVSFNHSTTLKTAKQTKTSTKPKKLGILNFASATTPGGGFLNGFQAQEESLARSTTLYKSLTTTQATEKYYNLHSKEDSNGDGIFSDTCICSPDVLVFVDEDNGNEIDTEGLWVVDWVVSCPAVDTTQAKVKWNKSEDLNVDEVIKSTMNHRIERILLVLDCLGCDTIVLGAYGCGVFRNNVEEVALAYKIALMKWRWKSVREVVFGILDLGMLETFERVFRE
ncbi:hypothetical protein HDU76_000675 [Blyttiomyces sp. JEL0837]|nr:hypothetical protein HDU76_000675 [Blyttiomyces sp. JEL0837]